MSAEITREAGVAWEGGLSDGSGRLSTPSGTADGAELGWDARLASGRTPPTSPEELIAAAHAGCYSMSLSHVLEQRGTPPAKLDVRARCVAEQSSGLTIKAVVLDVRGEVPGVDDETFQQLAQEAERSCPVSNALRGNVDIRLNAVLTG